MGCKAWCGVILFDRQRVVSGYRNFRGLGFPTTHFASCSARSIGESEVDEGRPWQY